MGEVVREALHRRHAMSQRQGSEFGKARTRNSQASWSTGQSPWMATSMKAEEIRYADRRGSQGVVGGMGAG